MGKFRGLARLVWGAGLAILSVSVQAEPATRSAQALVGQWLSLEQQRTRMRSDWATTEAALQQRLSLLQAERAALKKTLNNNRGERSHVDEKRKQLLQEQQRLETDQRALQQRLQQAAVQVSTLAPQLPPPLRDSWREPLAQLTADAAGTSERLQALLTLVKTFAAFNGRVALNSTTMTLASGRKILADQVFLGVAQGWYISADNRDYGRGRPTPSGWQWHEQANINPDDIRAIVKVLHDKSEPSLLAAPLKLTAGDKQ